MNITKQKTTLIDKILKGEVEIEHLEDGGFSSIFTIIGNEKLLLKKSKNRVDGFRFIATMPEEKRKEFAFRNIIEEKKVKGEYYYILENLKEIDFSEQEKRDLVYMFEYNELSDENKVYSTPRVEKIKNLMLKLVDHLAEKLEYCCLDLHYTNVMMNDDGEIFLTDPIAECEI